MKSASPWPRPPAIHYETHVLPLPLTRAQGAAPEYSQLLGPSSEGASCTDSEGSGPESQEAATRGQQRPWLTGNANSDSHSPLPLPLTLPQSRGLRRDIGVWCYLHS